MSIFIAVFPFYFYLGFQKKMVQSSVTQYLVIHSCVNTSRTQVHNGPVVGGMKMENFNIMDWNTDQEWASFLAGGLERLNGV